MLLSHVLSSGFRKRGVTESLNVTTQTMLKDFWRLKIGIRSENGILNKKRKMEQLMILGMMMKKGMHSMVTCFNKMLYSQIVQAYMDIIFYYLLTIVKSHSLQYI